MRGLYLWKYWRLKWSARQSRQLTRNAKHAQAMRQIGCELQGKQGVV